MAVRLGKAGLAIELDALADGVGRSDSSNERYSSCHQETTNKKYAAMT